MESEYFPNTRITYPSPYFPNKVVMVFIPESDDDSDDES